MDAAAKTVQSLSQQLLPERPHHLSFNPQWRFRPRSDETSHAGKSNSRPEEWQHNRLQYSTLCSHADRGILFTRSYYDMREEPPKPVPREVSALAKFAGDKKKKLSLSDYKNKKTGAPASASPPEPAIAKQREADRFAAGLSAQARDAPPTSKPSNTDRSSLDSHKSTDSRKQDVLRNPDLPSSLDPKPRHPRESAIDMRLPPKPPSLPPKPPSPTGRKRLADIEDEIRPQKRPRPDDRRPDDRRPIERLPPYRDDAARRKDRPQQSSRDPLPQRDDRPTSSSSLPNGRTNLKAGAHPARNPSPGGRPRGDGVNGTRLPPSGTNRGAPSKVDSSKSYVPPLLSPLHLSFDGHDRPGPDDDDLAHKKERKRRDDSGETGTIPKAAKKPEPLPGPKKNKTSLVIPPLLSPTLPPAVEAELQRRQKASPEPAEEKAKDKRDAEGIKRRPNASANDDDSGRASQRKRFTVTLQVPSHLIPSFKRILAPPAGRKTAQGQGPERGRERDRERDRGGSVEAAHNVQARKRPAGSNDGFQEQAATKRPRSSDVARVAATPSTPSKRPPAMSRVSSSNSLAQTPGETMSATPVAAPSAERRPNGQDHSGHRPDRPESKFLIQREERLREKAIDLKHCADAAMRSHRSPSMKGKLGESRIKLGMALGVESIIAFVMTFYSHNVSRSYMSRRIDHSLWESMFPLIDYLQSEIRGSNLSNHQPLTCVLSLLHAICLDEVIKAVCTSDNPPPLPTPDALLKMERRRIRMWAMARETSVALNNPAYRLQVSAWYNIDDITDAAMRMLRAWCSEERVDWTPEAMLKEYWPVNPK
ncbi:hypothetical protein HIM_00239 [Hirsutella minnesotensis 3608]|nr:hypothetical protein HIM_00239 [Hirsutella minnesotensis 3608]